MDIHFLGTTGYHPNQQRHTMCVMIPTLGLVFDAGTGFFRVREWIRTEQLTVLLSHAHLDHVIGLSYLFDVLWQRPTTVQVYGEAAKLAAIQQHLFHPTLFPVQPPFTACPLPQDTLLQANQTQTLQSLVQIDMPLATQPAPSCVDGPAETTDPSPSGGRWRLPSGVAVRWFPLQHPGGAVGYELELPNGRRLAYVTDTTATATADYLPWIAGVDLLIHECYFADGSEEQAELTGHSCLSPVLELARQAKVGHLALVHLNPLDAWAPTLAQARALAGDLPLSIPDDGQILTLM